MNNFFQNTPTYSNPTNQFTPYNYQFLNNNAPMTDAPQSKKTKKGRIYSEAYGDIEDQIMRELIKVKRLRLNENESFISPEREIMTTNESTHQDQPAVSNFPSHSDSGDLSRDTQNQYGQDSYQ
jgi:hypothetical protein